MIENEYVMTRDRYIKWTMPKFYALPIFYIYVVIFMLSILGLWYFIKHDATRQTILLFVFISFAVFYLAIFHKWVNAISQYKVLLKKAFNGNAWKQKIVINNDNIELYVNDELTNKVKWTDIKKVTIAKSSISLKRTLESDKITFFNDSYNKGTSESLITFIKEKYSKIPIESERIRYNR